MGLRDKLAGSRLDSAQAGGLIVVGAIVVLAAIRGGFKGVRVNIGD